VEVLEEADCLLMENVDEKVDDATVIQYFYFKGKGVTGVLMGVDSPTTRYVYFKDWRGKYGHWTLFYYMIKFKRRCSA
jgi:hypothetical protein